MPKHSLIRTASLLILLTILSGSLRASGGEQPAAQPPAPDRRLTAVGSEEILWLVISEWNEDQDEFTRRFIYREPGSDRIHPVVVATRPSRIGITGVVGDTLHAFFRDGSHIQFNKTRRFHGHLLPGKSVPLALAGEMREGQGRLWAVVPGDVAAKVRDDWLETQKRRATEPGDDEESPLPVEPSPTVLSAPNKDRNAPELVMYDGTGWQPGMPAPAEYSGSQRVWLAVSNGRFHLFWISEGEPSHIRYAQFGDNRWSLGAPISVPAPVEKAAAAVMNKQVVLAALLKQDDLATFRCGQWSRAAAAGVKDAWNEVAPLANEKGEEISLPAGSALGLFSDRLALLRFGEPQPELGLWTAGAGGRPDQPFEPLPAAVDEGAGPSRSLQDLVATLIVAAVLLILFWRRQETIASPLELPVELQIAGPARRAAAFVVDAAPAAAIMLWIWFDPLSAFYGEVKAAARAGEPLRDAPAQVLWAWFWFRVIYTSYSALFEWIMATTPGKRLLGCLVLSETLDRASFIQIAIRNLSRMIELEPFLKVWPFLLVLFFTRNRQRLGDLLARTIVVEHRPEASPDGDADENREDL